MTVDVWGEPIAAADASSADAWNDAWADTLHFVGDPFDRLASANETDVHFAMGPLFCATYRLLGGSPTTAPEVQLDVSRATERASERREVQHLDALSALVAGDFSLAAARWHRISTDGWDFAALRFAHDVYLHVGDAAGRLQSSTAARCRWADDGPAWNHVAGMHAFALEESGHYSAAEGFGWLSLEADPMDLWALHALAHVYESTEDQAAALSLLGDRQDTWSGQDSLAVHIWWHLCLRLITDGRYDEVLDIHDRLVPDATTSFRLCDLASMLWRLELCGVDVGDRWDHLADAFAIRPERHTSGFLDLHAALVYSRRPDHPEAERFFAGVQKSHADGPSENDRTFREVVVPLVDSIRIGEVAPAAAANALDRLDPVLHRIGGSVAQRHLIPLTIDRWRHIAEGAP